ncbi:hypothetical protein CLG94_04545 [Candidatus Methylomirabilis limnetica]|uniref:Uncharacterized protein n=1 Tax=Candidatus Methylomirabilis limnetica TaxID=2033718 RepID=A0A2T4TYW3_9BACT|nr:hypothetical protein CLG94_04545 [Candidatus Methylomirabilis limnetica]
MFTLSGLPQLYAAGPLEGLVGHSWDKFVLECTTNSSGVSLQRAHRGRMLSGGLDLGLNSLMEVLGG